MLEQGYDGVRTLRILNVQTWHNKLHLQTGGDLTQYNYLPPPPPQMMSTLVLKFKSCFDNLSFVAWISE